MGEWFADSCFYRLRCLGRDSSSGYLRLGAARAGEDGAYSGQRKAYATRRWVLKWLTF